MKKLLALLMAMVMLFALCSCSTGGGKDKDDDKNELTARKLEGDWEMRMDLSALLSSDSMEEMASIFQLMDPEDLDLDIKMDVTFEDGSLTFDPDGMVNFYEDIIDAMVDWLKEGDNVYEIMAQSDDSLSAADYKAALEAQGMSKADVIDMIEASIAESMPDTDSLVDEMGDIHYELDGDKLYTWNADEDEEKSEDEYFQFIYEDDTITVIKVVSEGETTKLDEGDFVFEKK